MNVTIAVSCDNAAFDRNPEFELSRILAELSGAVLCGDGIVAAVLRDIGGNVVGEMVVSPT